MQVMVTELGSFSSVTMDVFWLLSRYKLQAKINVNMASWRRLSLVATGDGVGITEWGPVKEVWVHFPTITALLEFPFAFLVLMEKGLWGYVDVNTVLILNELNVIISFTFSLLSV